MRVDHVEFIGKSPPMPHIILVTIAHDLYCQWNVQLKQLQRLLPTSPVSITTHHGSVEALFETTPPPHLQQPRRTAVVCPANSLLYMGGGFDRGVLEALKPAGQLYKELERYVQGQGNYRFRGYIPVHTVETVETAAARNDRRAYTQWNVDSLILAPLMVVPEPIDVSRAKSVIVDSMWNVLVHCQDQWDVVVVPGIGGGYGGIDHATIARLQVATLAIYYLDVLPLQRALLMLFLLGKDYRKYGGVDTEEMDTYVTDHGRHVDPAADRSLADILNCVSLDPLH